MFKGQVIIQDPARLTTMIDQAFECIEPRKDALAVSITKLPYFPYNGFLIWKENQHELDSLCRGGHKKESFVIYGTIEHGFARKEDALLAELLQKLNQLDDEIEQSGSILTNIMIDLYAGTHGEPVLAKLIYSFGISCTDLQLWQ